MRCVDAGVIRVESITFGGYGNVHFPVTEYAMPRYGHVDDPRNQVGEAAARYVAAALSKVSQAAADEVIAALRTEFPYVLWTRTPSGIVKAQPFP